MADGSAPASPPLLYASGHHLTIGQIFGRNEIIEEVAEWLRFGLSATLMGIRRIGVSTVLRAVAEHGTLREAGIPIVFVDLERCRNMIACPRAVLAGLLKRQAEHAGKSAPLYHAMEDTLRNLLPRIEHALEEITAATGTTPVLILDHFERTHGASLAWETTNSLQGFADQHLLSLVTSYGGFFRLHDETSYFKGGNKWTLRLLDSDAVSMMLTRPLADVGLRAFDERERDLVKWGGGVHPHFLALACDELLAKRDYWRAHTDEFRESFLFKAGGQYSRYLNDFSENQVIQVRSVAAGKISTKGQLDIDVGLLCVEKDGMAGLFAPSLSDFVERRFACETTSTTELLEASHRGGPVSCPSLSSYTLDCTGDAPPTFGNEPFVGSPTSERILRALSREKTMSAKALGRIVCEGLSWDDPSERIHIARTVSTAMSRLRKSTGERWGWTSQILPRARSGFYTLELLPKHIKV